MTKLAWSENTHEGLKEKVRNPSSSPGGSAVGRHPSDPITGSTWGQGHIILCMCDRMEHSRSCLNGGSRSQTTKGNNKCSSNKGWGSNCAAVLQGGRLWVKWRDVCDHSGQLRGGWHCRERPLRRGSFTNRKESENHSSSLIRDQASQEVCFKCWKGKKKTSHSSKSVHSETVFKNGEIKAFQANRSWENQISVGLFYKKCDSSPRRETPDWNWDPHRTLRSPGQVKIEVNIKGFFCVCVNHCKR